MKVSPFTASAGPDPIGSERADPDKNIAVHIAPSIEDTQGSSSVGVGQSRSGYRLDLSQDHVAQAMNERGRSSQAAHASSLQQQQQRLCSSSNLKLSLASDFWNQQQQQKDARKQSGLYSVVVYSGNYTSSLPEVPGAKVETLANDTLSARQPSLRTPPLSCNSSTRLSAGMAGLAVSGGRSEFPVVPVETQLVKVMLVWASTSAQNVQIKGSFDGWQRYRQMQQQPDRSWGLPAYLTPGIYQYKYVVDGVWRYDPWAPVVRDEEGNFNNVIEVTDPCTSFDIPSDFDPPKSPTSSYSQDLPSAADLGSEPPPLPPHATLTPLDIPTAAAPSGTPETGVFMAVNPAEHSVLNHIWSAAPARRSADGESANKGPLVIGASFRYHTKQVVALMYKARAESGRVGSPRRYADFNR